jgi:hypothetical protein
MHSPVPPAPGTYADSNFVFHGFVFTAATLTSTTTTVASAPNPSFYKEPVTLTAEVVAKSGLGGPPNGETVDLARAKRIP